MSTIESKLVSFNPKVVFANVPAEVFQLPFIHAEPAGLLSAMRKFSRLSLAALGSRLGYTKQHVHQLESAFDRGEGLMRTYRNMAAAMNYDMVVAFVPKPASVNDTQ